MERRDIKSASMPHELSKADSGFPPRQKGGEGKSFDLFDPERYPVSMVNALLDDLRWSDDESKLLTRAERTALEKLRDAPAAEAISADTRSEANDKLERYASNTLRINTIGKVLDTITEIASAHVAAGIDARHYINEAMRFRDIIIKSTGRGVEEQVPMDRSIPFGVRRLLIDLKRDLDQHHICDVAGDVAG